MRKSLIALGLVGLIVLLIIAGHRTVDLPAAKLVLDDMDRPTGNFLICRDLSELQKLEHADWSTSVGAVNPGDASRGCRWCDHSEINSVRFVDEKVAEFKLTVIPGLGGSGWEDGYWYTWRTNILDPDGAFAGSDTSNMNWTAAEKEAGRAAFCAADGCANRVFNASDDQAVNENLRCSALQRNRESQIGAKYSLGADQVKQLMEWTRYHIGGSPRPDRMICRDEEVHPAS